MTFLADAVLDNGLQLLGAEVDELWIISGGSDPADYAAALAARLGTKSAPTISAPQDGATSGRRVVVSSFVDGAVTADGTATRWCLVDNAADVLYTVKTLSSSQAVTNGNTFGLGALSVEIPDPA